MYRHVLGACEAGASMRENAHQLRHAWALRRRAGGPLEAALSALQVEERATLEGADIDAGWRRWHPGPCAAARAFRRSSAARPV
jgi:hypothetical protein